MVNHRNNTENTRPFRVWPVSCLAAAATVAFFSSPAPAQIGQEGTATDDESAALTFPERFQREVVEGAELHGRVGIYDFRRWHDLNQPYPGQTSEQALSGDDYNVQGTNYGAQIGVQTGRIYGFSAGAEFVYSSSFYGNNEAGTKLNCNLACGNSITNLTQGYLQFNAYGTQTRAGRQLLNTPLAGADQFTFLPRAFQGVSAVIRPLQTYQRLRYRSGDMVAGQEATEQDTTGPQVTESRVADSQNYETDQYLPFAFGADELDIPEWQIFGAKITRYEPRGNADSFIDDNRYFTDVAGFWSVGTTFRNIGAKGQIIGQYYHYRFQQTSSADYGELGYMLPVLGADSYGWSPYVRAQIMASYDANKERIPQGIDSQIYGLKLGVETADVNFSVFGNFSPINRGSFNDGQLLHPYTDLSGVLYTDTMNNGIQQFGPGWAAGARIDFTPTDNFGMYARYVKYRAQRGHYHDFYFNGGEENVIDDDSFIGEEVENQYSDAIGIGLIYDLGGIWDSLAGLKINNNLGITRYDENAPNFYNNRLRVFYEF